MTGTRFLVAGLILYIWRRLAGDPVPNRREWRSAIIIGTLLLVGGIGGVSLAEKYVTSGIAALIVAATPLWVVLIDAVRRGGTRPTWRSLTGVLVGMAGIFILVDQRSLSGQAPAINLLGVAVILLATLAWSVGSIYSHSAELPQSPLLGTGMELLAGGVGSFLVGLLTGEGSQLNISAISQRSLSGTGLLDPGRVAGGICMLYLVASGGTYIPGGDLCICQPACCSVLGKHIGRRNSFTESIGRHTFDFIVHRTDPHAAGKIQTRTSHAVTIEPIIWR